MNIDEFLQPKENEELDVQKAVVESLAAEKVEQDETIDQLRQENAKLKTEMETLDQLRRENAKLKAEFETLGNFRQEHSKLETEIENLKKKLEEQNIALARVGDVLAKNSEKEISNQVSLLDRNMELPDRFPGETRDHVIEALRESRDRAEAEGRVRRAQLLEGVLAVNESSGNLEKKRSALEKFFNENQNIVSGPVIEELERCGISHKKGEEYLLPSEILKRTF